MAFVECLEKMGCEVRRDADGITVIGRPLRGIDVDMNAISDTVQTLAVVAIFAEGPTRIRNVGHIRHKETDRIGAVATELRKLGVEVLEHDDGLTIEPANSQQLKAATIETYHDHRMAMSFALAGLRIPGVRIANPSCVEKTYPRFFEDLASAGPAEARGYLGRTGTTSVRTLGPPMLEAPAVWSSCSARSSSDMLEAGGG